MRIALVNYHYFINGGPDRYFFNIRRALEEQGHTVIPFCFDYAETRDTPYRHYFPPPITGPGPALFDQQRLSIRKRAQTLLSMFYNSTVNTAFRTALRDEKPDLIYMIYLSSSFLPNLIRIAKREFGLPVVYRLSDYHLFCASYLFCRDGRVCTACRRTLWAAVKYRCVKGSRLISTARAMQIKLFRRCGYYDEVDRFICPSAFMRRLMIESGYEEHKLLHIPTFAEDMKTSKENSSSSNNPQYILYCGNISKEKGIEALIRAYVHATTSLPLLLVGKYTSDYRSYLESLIPDRKKAMVKFTGLLETGTLQRIQSGARFIVHPALWYENSPNSVLEAMCLGKPILAFDIGSMPELVHDGINGKLVPVGDKSALTHALDELATVDIRSMGQQSRKLYEQNFTKQHHLEQINRIFSELLS